MVPRIFLEVYSYCYLTSTSLPCLHCIIIVIFLSIPALREEMSSLHLSLLNHRVLLEQLESCLCHRRHIKLFV